ncbi:SOS response-associated peptidase [Natrialbaceae archaeon A-arb3/5]
MCGRYTLSLEREDLEGRFDARFSDSFEPRYNAAPGQRLPVITNEEPATIQRFEWGLIPEWAEDDTNGIINARAETLDEKPSFREAYERRRCSREGNERGLDTPSAGRCLVPADGFYEWAETEAGKQPYRIAFEDDRVFAMAGLWERWEPETEQTGLDAFGGGLEDASDEGPLETFTIVTTEPNDLVAELHHRMAVILDPAAEDQWLSGDDPQALLGSYPDAELRAYPVSTAVNDAGSDEPSLIEPVDA